MNLDPLARAILFNKTSTQDSKTNLLVYEQAVIVPQKYIDCPQPLAKAVAGQLVRELEKL